MANQWQVLSAWCLLGWLLSLLWIGLEHVRTGASGIAKEQATGKDLQATFLVAVALLVMQGCTIALFARMNVGYALALFQIGSLVSVLLGHRLFGEAHLARRLIAATIMVVGAVIIIVAG